MLGGVLGTEEKYKIKYPQLIYAENHIKTVDNVDN